MNRKFCPKCKSTNVRKKMGALLTRGVPQEWRCNDCGYSSFIFPELKD